MTASARWAARRTTSCRSSRSETKWPKVFDGHPLFYEWTRDYFKVFELNRAERQPADGHPQPVPGRPERDHPGQPDGRGVRPDGALYTLEYGDGFFLETPEAQLSRIDFVRQNQFTPVPQVSADPDERHGAARCTVQFSSAGTRDPDGDTLAYAWDFDADGDVDSRQPNPSFTYAARGIYDATLRVTDSSGRSASASVRIIVGNTAPVVNLTVDHHAAVQLRRHGALHRRGDRRPAGGLRARARGLHPRPRPARAPAVVDDRLRGRHPGAAGRRGPPGRNISAVFVASYTDAPAGETPQTGSDEVILREGQ